MAELLSTMAQVPLDVGCRIVFEAIDPDTGAPVTGVVIQNANIYGYNLTPGAGSGQAPADEVPLWLPIPLEGADG